MASSTDKLTGDMIKDVKSIFLNALDRDTIETREQYLDSVCASDPELRRLVDRLLHAHNSADGFLDPEAFGPVQYRFPGDDHSDSSKAEQHGQKFNNGDVHTRG
ncbi:MAG: hypothetical protein HQ515_24125 [Phycisphaeraceae bacterium]|nr:hypothetical protein [Phycisphaeraceae bacterium]